MGNIGWERCTTVIRKPGDRPENEHPMAAGLRFAP
jgi:hypothetical protein